ncbi:DJ-1/PfpI family protein [Psychroflexus tropicus]|uniref:DJ-1/PfpI family protein n=1 Tax=Psychroflexus tropicus TaxID=197345 RepID=UPI00037D6BBB|nr:DJ-1/PfpI family protein [Psychroflexus tropicus]
MKKIILIFPLLFFICAAIAQNSSSKEDSTYICPPCDNSCDQEVYSEPGICSQCNMALVKRELPKTIAFYLQDGVEVLDFAGPLEVFSYAGYEVYTVSKNRQPIKSQGVLTITPDYSIDDAPQADILAFFGGNASSAYEDENIINWIRQQQGVQYYFSVCTGAFILAQAGILDGKIATTFHDALPDLEAAYPAIDVRKNVRFVDNGNIITTAGISAGIDGALHLVAKLKGFEAAKRTAYYMEYDNWEVGNGLILSDDDPYPKQISYKKLQEYEGEYEYINNSSLLIFASELDTTLYALIDGAKYPLNYMDTNKFTDIQGKPVIFQRDKKSKVKSYKTEGKTFAFLNDDFDRSIVYPRKELYGIPDSYAYQVPKDLNDGLSVGNLETTFDNSQPIIEMVKETIMGHYPDVHSILIHKNDKLVLEEYFYGYDKNTPHQLRSATKPFIGGVLGIAIDKGFIKSEDDRLLPYFNSRYQEIANMDDRKKDITIENFLRYRHGMDCENNNPESEGYELKMMQSEDWVKHTLDLPMVKEPGQTSSYCTGCPLTLGSLVEITTEKNIEDFAEKNLFEPLGISNYDWTFEPNQKSINMFSQMYITPRDLIKLAKLYKDGGKWKGNQIISEEWVNKTFDTEEGDYGYGWEHKYFIIDGKRYNSYLATGNGGQKINIWPELDMITVFTGGNYNSYALYGKSTPPNEMIPKYILKALE